MIVPYEEEYLPQLLEHFDEDEKLIFREEHYEKLLSVKEGKVLGWCVLERSHDRLLIEWIYVKEEHRREGVGSELMAAIKERARQSGVRGISVNTGSNTSWARHFYEKHGFEEVGRVKEYFSFDPEHVFYWFPL